MCRLKWFTETLIKVTNILLCLELEARKEQMYTYPCALGHGHGCFTAIILLLFLFLSLKITVFTALSWNCSRADVFTAFPFVWPPVLRSSLTGVINTFFTHLKGWSEEAHFSLLMYKHLPGLCALNIPPILFLYIPQIGLSYKLAQVWEDIIHGV